MFKGAGCAADGQKWLRYAQTHLYGPTVGYSGDEDNGEMASWFVLSALGIYQLVPGSLDYEIGSPLFSQAKINLPGGKILEISAPNNAPNAPYVASVTWNGEPLPSLKIGFDKLSAGGVLSFNMSADAREAVLFASP